VRLSRSVTSSIPTIAPRPRTSPMQANWSAHWRKRAFTRSPVRCARAGIRSDSIASSTATAAAQASGFPPKVPPRPPTWGASITSAEPGGVGHTAAPARRPLGAAIAVGIRDPVHLGRERPEPLLAGHHLRGERHGQVGAAVEAVLEADHGLPAREEAGHLDRVLHRL